MKNSIIPLLFIIISLISCQPEDIDNLIDNGNNNKYDLSGTWHCSENSTSFGLSQFIVVINNSSTIENEIVLTNFYNLGSNTEIIASINNENIIIEKQILFKGQDEEEIWGTGQIINNQKINFTYYSNDYSVLDTIVAVFNKEDPTVKLLSLNEQ